MTQLLIVNNQGNNKYGASFHLFLFILQTLFNNPLTIKLFLFRCVRPILSLIHRNISALVTLFLPLGSLSFYLSLSFSFSLFLSIYVAPPSLSLTLSLSHTHTLCLSLCLSILSLLYRNISASVTFFC